MLGMSQLQDLDRLESDILDQPPYEEECMQHRLLKISYKVKNGHSFHFKYNCSPENVKCNTLFKMASLLIKNIAVPYKWWPLSKRKRYRYLKIESHATAPFFFWFVKLHTHTQWDLNP